MEPTAPGTNMNSSIDTILDIYVPLYPNPPGLTQQQIDELRVQIRDFYQSCAVRGIETQDTFRYALNTNFSPNFREYLHNRGIDLSDEEYVELFNKTFGFYIQYKNDPLLRLSDVPKNLRPIGGKRRTNKRIKYLKNKTRKNLFRRKYKKYRR